MGKIHSTNPMTLVKVVCVSLVVLSLFASWVIYGTFYNPSEVAVSAYLRIRGARDVHVSITNNDGRKEINVYCGCVKRNPRIFAGVPNIVTIEGSYDSLDVKSLNRSPCLYSVRVGLALLVNPECLIDFDCLENVEGCVDAPFVNTVLIERNKKWNLAIRANGNNLERICEMEDSQDYDLEIADRLLKGLSKKQIGKLSDSKYRHINRKPKELFFKEHSEALKRR